MPSHATNATDPQPEDPVPSTTADPTKERRTSLDHIRAVGHTFAEGLSALRGHVSTTQPRSPPQPTTPPSPSPGAAPPPSTPATTSHIPRSPSAELAHLRALLSSAEDRAARSASEAGTLRQRLSEAEARSSMLQATLSETRSSAAAAAREHARLRASAATAETETARVAQARVSAETRAADATARADKLERVLAGVRRRAALAEARAANADQVPELRAARERAERDAAAARADAERARISAAASTAFRERAEAAERSERSMRQQVDALRRELDGGGRVVQEALAERTRLADRARKLEDVVLRRDERIRELLAAQRKDAGIAPRRARADTRAGLRHGRSREELGERRRGRGSEHGSEHSDSAHSDSAERPASWSPGLAADTFRMGPEWDGEMLGAEPAAHEPDNMDDGLLAGRASGGSAAASFAAASPLLRQVEETNAQLNAVFAEGDASVAARAPVREAGEEANLVERVRLLEEGFGLMARRRVGRAE